MTQLHFPEDFYWGASTASHQVEGGTHTQWDVWEKNRTNSQARTTKSLLKSSPAWPAQRQFADDPNTYIAGQAVDHYNRYTEDFDILQQLNMNAFRFSIEWARIEPGEGEWDESEIAHYRAYIEQLRSRSIEPFVTLWHFTNPTWFEDKGGFTKKSNVEFFIRYVTLIMDRFGDLLSFVIPLNEPNTYAMLSYVLGWWPPQKRNLSAAVKVYKNLIECQRQTYDIIKATNPSIQVGIAMAMSNDVQKHKVGISSITKPVSSYLSNWWFLNNCRGKQDFIGVNYYLTNYFAWHGGWNNPKTPHSDLDWYMEPRSIEALLVETYQRYKLPIYITENGLADANDTHRQWWISETIAGMQAAIDKGVDLRGYLHWSLLDNFEWAFGWLAEFGLVHVDRSTMQRTIRPSAKWYGEQIARFRGKPS